MRPIDADVLIEKCGDWYVEEGTESGFIGTLKNLLSTMPTVQHEKAQLSKEGTTKDATSDLISRQAAIDAAKDWYEGLICGSVNGLIKRLNALPSVQPEPSTNCSEIPNSSDTISRQAVIDALHTWFRDGFDEDKWWNSTHVLAAIEGLHPVQQEHKWETCFECPLSHGCPKIKGCTNEQAIEYASQIPNDCPLSAQPEPHEGYWIGKYPTTHICSECGWLIPDSKVKVFAYCPNCGARMKGERQK